MSFSRPDPASPAQIADASFATGRRGFDQGEVRDFLRMVSAELGRLQERQVFLERELQHAQEQPNLDTTRLDDETLTRMLGEETARVLSAAKESAHEIREKAEQSAARMLMEASDESTRLREEAEIEASRRRADAANDAEAELSMAKQQGREMVNEARAYRERVLSELARRRELARQQIEQLVHGRDRLMQAFERARLVAVDVVAEMQPLGEPDEYVDLTPSTGPVPVMIARDAAERADAASSGAAAAAARTAADEAHAESPADDVAPSEVGVADESVVAQEPGEAAADDSGDQADDDAGNQADNRSEPFDGEADADDDEVEPGEVDTGQDAIWDSQGAAADRGGAPDPDDGSVDDVVVDLFARLRADATDNTANSDDDSSDDDSDTAVDTEDSDAQDGDAQDGDTQNSALQDGDVDPLLSVDPIINLDEPEPEATVEIESDIGDDTIFDRRNADLTPLIVASARKLKRVLADEQNEVLDALRRSDPVRTLDDLLPWASDHADRYSSMIADDLLVAANSGAALLNTERVTKLSKSAGKQSVSQASEMIGQWLVDPLRDRLERCVADGDGDNPAITKKVRAVYREFKTQHIDEQLDDVVRAAHGHGLLAGLSPDTPVEWTPDPAHQACADCDDNRLAGSVAAGQAFPTGHTSTPAHPGCRCMLIPTGR